MPNNGAGFYWDSCVFLAFLNGESDRDNVVWSSYVEITERNQKIYTSTIAIVEASHSKDEREDKRLDQEVVQKLEMFWNSKSIVLVELNPIIARNARNIIRDNISQGIKLTPKDAVHISTAKFVNTYLNNVILEFHTYDNKLEKFTDLLSIPVKKPYCNQLLLI